MRKLLTALCLVGLLVPTPAHADDGRVTASHNGGNHQCS